MEYQHKLLIAIGILVAVAAYIILTLPPAEVEVVLNNSEAEDLLLRSAGFGRGLENYAYSYNELSDGYTTKYSLVNNDARMIEIMNPLSVKKVYLMENDTLFCISYPTGEEDVCSSVEGNSEMENYVSFVQSKFYSDSNIDKAKSSIAYLIEQGYLSVMPEIEDSSVEGTPCSRIQYNIDYSNLSLDEAARFGISSNSPRLFMLNACINEDTGMVRQSTLEYMDNDGKMHSRTLTVDSFSETNVAEVVAPEANGDAVSVLRNEREQQVKLVACHTDKEGEEKDDCVADMSLLLKRKDLCDLSGSLRDLCLVRLVPMTKDESICTAITSLSFQDDCYIELAGVYENSTYCSSIQNQSKIEHCEEISVPKNVTLPYEEDIDMEGFLNYIDDYDTGETTEENSTG